MLHKAAWLPSFSSGQDPICSDTGTIEPPMQAAPQQDPNLGDSLPGKSPRLQSKLGKGTGSQRGQMVVGVSPLSGGAVVPGDVRGAEVDEW